MSIDLVQSLTSISAIFLNSKTITKDRLEKFSDKNLLKLQNNNNLAIATGEMSSDDHFVKLVNEVLKERGLYSNEAPHCAPAPVFSKSYYNRYRELYMTKHKK